jgi:O-antigen biosynthesis protein WbqP
MNKKAPKYQLVKRVLDIIFSFLGIFLLCVPLLILGLILKITSKGPIIHWSIRSGMNNVNFKMAKLRTMKIGTPVLSENKFDKPDKYYIYIGKFLRKYGIDELPQLYNILIGEMSFVGPRPVILSDKKLIEERTKRGINIIKPGLTGWAQINGRSELSILEKVEFEEFYINNMSFMFDMKIILKTNSYLFNSIFKENYPKSIKAINSSIVLIKKNAD